MKINKKPLLVVFAISAILISACGGATATQAAQDNQSAVKVQAVEMAYTGVVESMDGTQWVINGQTVTLDPSVVREGPFFVGDTVKVEGKVQADGSVLITRIEKPNATDLSGLGDEIPLTGDVPTALVFDDSGEQAWGTVDAIDPTSVTINGQSFDFASGAEIKAQVSSGSFVKLHFIVNPDGTLTVREIELSTPAQMSDDTTNANSNDDKSNSLNTNDDNSNDDNSNADDSSNNNENDDNSNNSKGDKGGDSGKGGGDDNSNDGNSGGSDDNYNY